MHVKSCWPWMMKVARVEIVAIGRDAEGPDVPTCPYELFSYLKLFRVASCRKRAYY